LVKRAEARRALEGKAPPRRAVHKWAGPLPAGG
jgi:hypothetical protein